MIAAVWSVVAQGREKQGRKQSWSLWKILQAKKTKQFTIRTMTSFLVRSDNVYIHHFVICHVSSCIELIKMSLLLLHCIFMPPPPNDVGKELCNVFRLSHWPFMSILPSMCSFICSFVHLSAHILLPLCLMNGWNSFDKINRKYYIAPTDDLIRYNSIQYRF